MRKTHLFLCSHGSFAKELVSSAEMIVGSMSDLHIFSLLPGMSMEEFRQSISAKMDAIGADDEFLCLVDLYGGTPSTTVLSLMREYRINIVTGLNLAMLIEVYFAMTHQMECDFVQLAYETLRNSGKKFCYSELKGSQKGD